MSPEGWTEFAARITAAIPDMPFCKCPACKQCRAERERVASDLAGIHWHATLCHDCNVLDLVCVDLARDEAGLLRTGRLYRVTP